MLEGVKILSFTHYLQGPSAAQSLADLGADVIKVESCKGAYERKWSGCNTYKNGVSVFYLMAIRNQRNLSLDLKSEEGCKIIYKLVQEYDVILENFRPGVMDKLGLGYEELKKHNPQIIYCSCTGYGSSGPKWKKPGQDLIIQGMSGMAALGGPGDHAPFPAGTALVDQHGAILAALGILAAVYDRKNTGNGHKIEASLLNASLDLQIEPLSYFLNGGELGDRAETGLSTRFHQSPYGVYRTADTYVTLSLTPFDKLEKMFTPDALAGYSAKDQMEKRIEFDKIVCEEMQKKTTAEWMKIFEELDVWASPCNDYEDMVKDEQVIYNKPFITVDHPVAGEITLLNHPNRYDGKTLPLRRVPPELGQDTIEILKRIGYSKKKIDVLKDEGIIVAR